MADERHLVVNADDFGLSPGVNRGVIEAHEAGIVTSASLMVRWPGAAEAAAALVEIVAGLPPGVTELACHPAAAVDFESAYAAERVEELRALCDPAVREAVAVAGVRLVSFRTGPLRLGQQPP